MPEIISPEQYYSLNRSQDPLEQSLQATPAFQAQPSVEIESAKEKSSTEASQDWFDRLTTEIARLGSTILDIKKSDEPALVFLAGSIGISVAFREPAVVAILGVAGATITEGVLRARAAEEPWIVVEDTIRSFKRLVRRAIVVGIVATSFVAASHLDLTVANSTVPTREAPALLTQVPEGQGASQIEPTQPNAFVEVDPKYLFDSPADSN